MKNLIKVMALCGLVSLGISNHASAQSSEEAWAGSLPSSPGVQKAKLDIAEAEELEHKGEEYLSKKKYSESINAFEASLTLREGSYVAYSGLIEAYTASGQTQKVLATYRRFVYFGPDRRWMGGGETEPVVLTKFALLLNKAGEWKEAVSVYQQAVLFVDRNGPLSANGNHLPVAVGQQFNPDIPESGRFEIAARNALGIGYYKRSREKEAVAEWEAVLKLQPKNPYAHFYLGQFAPLLKDKDLEAAANHYAQAEQYGTKNVREAIPGALQLRHPTMPEAFRKVKQNSVTQP